MNSDSDTYSSDENELDKLQNKMEKAKIKRGMFVSGWEDPDDSIEEVENPRGKNIYLNNKNNLIKPIYFNYRN